MSESERPCGPTIIPPSHGLSCSLVCVCVEQALLKEMARAKHAASLATMKLHLQEHLNTLSPTDISDPKPGGSSARKGGGAAPPAHKAASGYAGGDSATNLTPELEELKREISEEESNYAR